jgi:hypothetical protein
MALSYFESIASEPLMDAMLVQNWAGESGLVRYLHLRWAREVGAFVEGLDSCAREYNTGS